MRKLSEINEGILSKTLNRSKTGEARLEDKLPPNNLKEIEPIDLSIDCLIADKKLIINEKDHFTLDELLQYLPKLEKSGWRLPTEDEVRQLMMLNNCEHYMYNVRLFNKNKSNVINFDMDYDSFFAYSPKWKENEHIICAIFNPFEEKNNYIKLSVYMDSVLYSIRLVKDKKFK